MPPKKTRVLLSKVSFGAGEGLAFRNKLESVENENVVRLVNAYERPYPASTPASMK